MWRHCAWIIHEAITSQRNRLSSQSWLHLRWNIFRIKAKPICKVWWKYMCDGIPRSSANQHSVVLIFQFKMKWTVPPTQPRICLLEQCQLPWKLTGSVKFCLQYMVRVPTRYCWKSIEFQNWFSRPWKSVGTEVVGYCRGPYWLKVNLVVAGAQVGLPTKQPDVLKLPSQSKTNKRLSPLCSLLTLQ